MDAPEQRIRDVASQAMAGWRAGVWPDAQSLAAGYPQILEQKSLFVDLAYEEYCLRLERGEEICSQEFCRRFPEIESSLLRQIEVHRYLIQGTTFGLPNVLPAPGEEYLGFEIEEEIGRGAFSRVYLARQPDIGGRQIVLKVSSGCEHEAQALGRLEHPNIMPIYSTQQDEGVGASAVCMPLMGRSTLRELIIEAYSEGESPTSSEVIKRVARRGVDGTAVALPSSYIAAVVHLSTQLADALAYAHGRGVVHRDLKPSNVLLSDTAKPLLLDFNLASHETSIVVGGTIPYMSPEHIQAVFLGGLDDIDERCDIYSFGVVLYELLTGKLPFGNFEPQSSTTETARAWGVQQRERFIGLQEANPRIDHQLARFVDRCLAWNPTDRPATMREVARFLRRYLGWRAKLKRSVLQHVALLTASLAIGVVFLVGLVTYYASRPSSTELQMQRGKLALHEGDYQEALQQFQLATNQEEPLSEAYYWQGRARLASGNLAAAANDFETAAKMDPQGLYLASWAYCLCRLGHAQSAVMKSKSAIDAGYTSPTVYNNLGRAYFQWNSPGSDHLEEAWHAYSTAVKLDPAQVEPRLGRIVIHIRNVQAGGSLDLQAEALKDARTAVSLAPPNGNLYFLAAMTVAIASHDDSTLVAEGLTYLEMAAANGLNAGKGQWARMDAFAHFNDDPRFGRLVSVSIAPRDRAPEPLEFLIVPE
jgi:serine/threonine protein kinase